MKLRVLALEPYHGGSHAAFLAGWGRRSAHRFDLEALPASHWKWRMRGGAATLARRVEARCRAAESWDVLVASDMLDLAAFRGLAPAAVADLPAVVYFHENQLTYPVRREAERDLHFPFTNLTTALAATEVWFNSAFHRAEWLAALPGLLARMPDHRPEWAVREVAVRCRVEPPGIEWPGGEGEEVSKGKEGGEGKSGRERNGDEEESTECEARSRSGEQPGGARGQALRLEERRPGPLRILWAARWEHDKAPERVFAAVERLARQGVDFRLSVLGQAFREVPEVFAQARRRFAERIDRWGYLEERDEYRQALAEADVVVSTADHEFFGLAVVEAVAAGCYPLLPRRLAYPEVLAGAVGVDDFLYAAVGSDEAKVLAERLAGLAARLEAGGGRRRALWDGDPERARRAVRRYAWGHRAPALDAALAAVAAAGGRPR